MKNTDIKDFNCRVKIGQKVTITYDGYSRTFDNRKNNNQSLWQMCEGMILDDLQYWWDYADDGLFSNYKESTMQKNSENYHKKENQLMNKCKIKFH